MSIPKKEMDSLTLFLEEIDHILPVTNREINELKAQKGLNLKQPTLGVCTINLSDEIISDLELRYFPSDWNWGAKQNFLRNRIYLQDLTMKKPISSLTKPPFFGGMGVNSIEGNEEIKVSKGFRKHEIIGYKFKSQGRNKDNKKIVQVLNADEDLIQALNQEFSISYGRPLPDLSIEGKIRPYGGLDVFNLDDEIEKISEHDFWEVKDPNSANRLFNRYNVIRKLAKALSDPY